MTVLELVKNALLEDMPNGDVTTDPLHCEKINGRAKLVAKENLILSGTEFFDTTFKTVDPQNQLHWSFEDGDGVSKGQVICEISGPLASLLKAERTALNFLGHLSGVATLTSKFVEETLGTRTKITDTRKTTPSLREFEKAAVRHGGGTNHRLNLSDRVLIKENHIRAAGSITQAVEKIRGQHPTIFIEVEVTNFKELDEALNLNVQEVLLDNMSLEMTAEAVKKVGGRCLIEASGNMSLDRIESVAKLGVDFISVGQLTHSAPTADISLLFDPT